MPNLSDASLKELGECDPRLVELMKEVIKFFDFTVLEGHRGEREQNIAFAKGLSQKRWPEGRHNSKPSKALDIAPYPIDWKESEKTRQRFVLLAGYVLCIAAQKGLKIRWGGDWDRDQDTRDENFRDLPHFELVD